MNTVVLMFLAVSMLLYVILAGADFGAGIVELFSKEVHRKSTKKTIYRVIGPVWEANHIWLILMLVILWVGYPKFYNIVMIHLHLPLTLVILGITLRGVAFIFRHYDAYQDQNQRFYDPVFKLSSLLTPFFLGLCCGAMLCSSIPLTPDLTHADFYSLYVRPWFQPFSVLVGFFFSALCAFLAAVLLIGEAMDAEELSVFRAKALAATIAVVCLGGVALLIGYRDQLPFVLGFIDSPTALTLVVLSAVMLLPLWRSIIQGRRILSRFFAGFQVVLILGAAFVPIFPQILFTTTGTFDLQEGAAPDSVIHVLGVSLLIGGTLIIPGLFHLYKSFKMIKILERNT